jgi:hypothetical protein
MCWPGVSRWKRNCCRVRPLGVTTPYDNYQNYADAVAAAQAGSYQLTVANDNKLYAFKTLAATSTQSQNILIKELPAHSVFIANSDPKGGAVAVRVTQSGDYAAMQNYFDTVKPYDFSWRSALAPMANDPNTGAFVANWVMGSHQVQAYQLGIQNQPAQTGNEAFGVLAWDANQNKYVMLDPTNTQATAGSVSGNMPTLGNNQFGFFGMHTHPGSATASAQDVLMTQQLGLDQMVIGINGTAAIFANNPSNNWQGKGFEFEGPYSDAYPKNPARNQAPGKTVGIIDGFPIVAGEVKGGTSFFNGKITLDPSEKDEDIGGLLGHEAGGHGTQYREKRQVLSRLPNESRQNYVDRMVALSIKNEAEAVISEGTESTSRLYPDEKHYVQAYLDGKITKEEVLSIISNIYQDRNPSTEPTQTYEVYYREHFEKAVPSENPATVAPSKEESSSDGESSKGSSGY